jgi:hypothetical protein
MGRIVDLCGEVAAAADEDPEGRFQLSAEAREQLRGDWSDEDIDDALALANAQSLANDLMEAADSMSARLLELLGTWGEARAWKAAVEGHASISIDTIRQLAHRLDHLEEVLDLCRDQKAPDRRAFDALQRRLMDQGIEDEMRPDWEKEGTRDGKAKERTGTADEP